MKSPYQYSKVPSGQTKVPSGQPKVPSGQNLTKPEPHQGKVKSHQGKLKPHQGKPKPYQCQPKFSIPRGIPEQHHGNKNSLGRQTSHSMNSLKGIPVKNSGGAQQRSQNLQTRGEVSASSRSTSDLCTSNKTTLYPQNNSVTESLFPKPWHTATTRDPHLTENKYRKNELYFRS